MKKATPLAKKCVFADDYERENERKREILGGLKKKY